MAPISIFLTFALAALIGAAPLDAPIPFEEARNHYTPNHTFRHHTPHHTFHGRPTPTASLAFPSLSSQAQPDDAQLPANSPAMPERNVRVEDIGLPGAAGSFFAKRNQPPIRRSYPKGAARPSGVAAATGSFPTPTTSWSGLEPETTPGTVAPAGAFPPGSDSGVTESTSTLTELRTITQGPYTRTITITRTLRVVPATATGNVFPTGATPTGGFKRSLPAPKEWLAKRKLPGDEASNVPRAYALY